MSDDVEHPGERPELFAFPFDQAQQLIERIEELVGAIDEATTARHNAMGSVPGDTWIWAGQSQQHYVRRTGDALDELGSLRAALDGDVELLREAIAYAHQRREETEEALSRWRTDLARYREQQHADGRH